MTVLALLFSLHTIRTSLNIKDVNTFTKENSYHSVAGVQMREYQAPRQKFIQKKVRPFPRTKSPWHGHFSAQNFRKTEKDKKALLNIKKNLQISLLALPSAHTDTLRSLEVRKKNHVSRGLANSRKIILNTEQINDNDELSSVFVHEMGHIVDLGYLRGTNGEPTAFKDNKTTFLSDDPSVKFYEISWKTTDKRILGATRNDFVSGYAQSNAFEDFAESYLFYRFHGEKFRAISKNSIQLKKKYFFMKEFVFNGQEFQKTKRNTTFVQGVLFDATLLPIDTPRLLVRR